MDSSDSELMKLLQEAEQLLCDERLELCKLDPIGIDEAAARKVAISAKLAALMPMCRTPSAAERKALERVRGAAQTNQLLLAHARGCVERAIALATGTPMESYPGKPSSAAPAVRVNLTG